MGIKVSEKYPSKYIVADDLDGRRIQVHIEKVEPVQVSDFKDHDKMVDKFELTFAGKSKTMLIGPKNAKKLAREISDDVDGWIDKVVEIWAEVQNVAGTDRDVLQIGLPQETVTAEEAEF